ncbi:protein EPIDERMAL PATTERNING FACTOR 2-like [Amaranthus tricolor]|uniref:protein EPIDERMAL PATTERNING FACTOR 2-like n=1 Tax=Amaranthus tricolor TaxID=29722 RepID=UPI00258EFEA2|nr:protein EPIDERMAL PATTERNING FACTOR 2-like [Amaranthus tricolor]
MKFSLNANNKYYLLFLLLIILFMFSIGVTTHYSNPKQHYLSANLLPINSIDGDLSHSDPKGGVKEELEREVYPMGSSLPDCTHACGVCSPCKRVMVSFKCSSESCPIVYRCMCNGKYYHVPSSK